MGHLHISFRNSWNRSSMKTSQRPECTSCNKKSHLEKFVKPKQDEWRMKMSQRPKIPRRFDLVDVICGLTSLPFFPRLVDWLNRKLVYSKLESKLHYQLNFCPMANVLKTYAKMHSDASCMCPICPKIRSSKCLLGELQQNFICVNVTYKKNLKWLFRRLWSASK